MSNLILHVAIHDLIKAESGFSVKIGAQDLKTTPTIQRVIDDLYELYSRRGSKTHGQFSDLKDQYPTEKHLTEYVGNPALGFPMLTQNMMQTLQMRASHTAAEGGHVFFAHFQRESKQYLLVAIVTDKIGAALNADYDVRDIQHLDMEGFRFAGRINMTGWAAGEQRYISFLKGKGDISLYFQEFLGCDTTSPDKQDTLGLIDALEEYANEKKMTPIDKDDFLRRAYGACDRAARNREEVDFQALANEVMPHNPDDLLLLLNNPERTLNDRFVPNRRYLKRLLKFTGVTKYWNLEFERAAVTQGKISYNAERNTLTLHEVPSELADQLREEGFVQ